MNRIIRFFASASWPLLLVGCSVIAMLGTLAVFSLVAWHGQQTEQRNAAAANDILLEEKYRQFFEREAAERGLHRSPVNAAERVALQPEFAKLLHDDTPSLVRAFGHFAATFAALVLPVALLRAFTAEPHPGWRRVAILSPAIGLVGGWAFGWSEYESLRAEVVITALVGAMLSFALFVLGRRITLWVLAGFGQHARTNVAPSEPIPTPAVQATATAEPARLAGKTGKRLVLAATVALAMFGYFISNPARALESTLSALFTVAGLAVILYVLRRISDAIDYWRRRLRADDS